MQALQKNQYFGRFRIERLLAEGAHGQVFLAEDSHLGRRVAIKTLPVARGATATAERLIDEARTISKLTHRNIATLYDAGEHEGLPYLVLEYVAGVTLEDKLRKESSLAIGQAVDIALQMLAGVSYAHERGILHRDIKPGNLMIDQSGTPRLMDFGVAAQLDTNSEQGTVFGTPRYLAPECLERREFSKATDVYAVAATLYEAVTGEPVVAESDPGRALERLRSGRIVPPSRHNPEVDERLDSIIRRGLAPVASDRFSSADDMAAALKDYIDRPAAEQPSSGSSSGAIGFLLRRMQHKKDFPALSESMRAINRIVASDDASASSLSALILKDFALTNKLLKVVNTAVYGNSGKISTVSRAVVILGFKTVRSIAVTLLFLGHLENKAQVKNLQEEVIGTLLAGLMARELTRDLDPQSRETSFLYAIYQSLGRLLAYYYFYDEAVEINRLMQQDGTDEAAAAQQVLGVTYEKLGLEIAKTWNFPQEMLFAMKRLPAGKKPGKPRDGGEKLWLISSLAEDLRQANLNIALEDHDRILGRFVSRYESVLAVTPDRLRQVSRRASRALMEEAEAMNIDTRRSRVLEKVHSIENYSNADLTRENKILDGAELERSMKLAEQEAARAGAEPEQSTIEPHAVLTAGIQDITATLVGDFKLNDLLHMVIETMYSGMGFTRVIFAILNDRTQCIEGRLGLGSNLEESLRKFVVPANDPGDLFAAALKHGKDILIADASKDDFRLRLPEWFTRAFVPESFILFPLVVNGRPFGVFYAEQEQPGRLKLDKTEADLLITLRNQAVLAIRQSSSQR